MIVGGIFFSLIIGAFIGSASSGMQAETQIKEGSVLKLTLPNGLPEQTNNTNAPQFDFNHPDVIGLQDLVSLIESAAHDDRIKGMYIDGNMVNTNLSSARLIASAIDSFKTSGKPVVAHANHYSQLAYYLCSAADHIMLSSTGVLQFTGFGAIRTFVKETLDKIGIEMQIFYAGNFKSATEPFRRTDMSEESRQQTREYIDATYHLFLSDIASRRSTTVAHLKEVSNNLEHIIPQITLKEGLVDELGYSNDAYSYLKDQVGMSVDEKLNVVSIQDYFTANKPASTGDRDTRIAVVFAEGEIRDGRNENGFISGDRYTNILKKLKQDDKVKAIVLRVNSPGGSVISSDQIWQEIEDIQAKGKPVIVSMGDVAASGGYYISCGSDKIFCEPSTLTGSIGVFMMYPVTRSLMEDKLLIHYDTVSTSKYSTRLNSLYKPDAEESKTMQYIVDNYYDTFLSRVSEGRQMSKEAVHEIAQGRIWTGPKAIELGLADEIGTLDDAIDEAARMADVTNYRIYQYPEIKNQWEQLLQSFTNQQDVVRSNVEQEVDAFIPGFSQMKYLMTSETPQAMMLWKPTY